MIGAIDGVFISMDLPSIDGYQFRGRKGPGLNVVMICDALGKILYVNPRYPASCHDSSIYTRSVVKQAFINGVVPGGYCLIGDSGFANGPDMMTPHRDSDDLRIKAFNMHHKKSRVIIEQVFGMLKKRFKILKKTIHHKPEMAAKIIIACAVLHNFLLARGIGIRDLPVPPVGPAICVNNRIADPRAYITGQL